MTEPLHTSTSLPTKARFTPAGATAGLIGITALLRMLAIAVTGLGYGESYYFSAVNHLDWSYFDQPPLAFWLARLSTELTGTRSALTLRLPFVLLFAGTCWGLFLLTRRLFNARAGFFAVLCLNLSAVFTGPVAMWLQPDGPLMFFWVWCAYAIVRLLFDLAPPDKPVTHWQPRVFGMWVIIGLLLGLTTLSKYHALFLLAGVGLFCLTSRKYRRWVLHPGPYLAIGVATLCAWPILWWNMHHHWISFTFQAGRAATDESSNLHPMWVVQSIAGQALWLLPWIWMPLIAEWPISFIRGWRDRDDARWFCAWCAPLPIIVFTVVTLWANLGFHFHWQAPGYLMLFPALGDSIHRRLTHGGRITRWWLGLSAAFSILAMTLLTAHQATGCWQWYGPKWLATQLGEDEDPTLEGLDYDQLIDRFEEEQWFDKPELFVFTNRWHLAGKMDWALKGRMPVLCLHEDARNLAFFNDQNLRLGQNAIYITRKQFANNPDPYRPYFQSIEKLQPLTIKRAGRPELTLDLYYCRGFKKPYPMPYPATGK